MRFNNSQLETLVKKVCRSLQFQESSFWKLFAQTCCFGNHFYKEKITISECFCLFIFHTKIVSLKLFLQIYHILSHTKNLHYKQAHIFLCFLQHICNNMDGANITATLQWSDSGPMILTGSQRVNLVRLRYILSRTEIQGTRKVLHTCGHLSKLMDTINRAFEKISLSYVCLWNSDNFNLL